MSVLGGAVLYVVLLLTGSAGAVVSLANVAAIAAMAVINIAAIVAMRHDADNGVRLPGGPVLPALGLLTALSQHQVSRGDTPGVRAVGGRRRVEASG